MDGILLFPVCVLLFLGTTIFRQVIGVSLAKGWVAQPDLRRRHLGPVPFTGGVANTLLLFAGVGLYSLAQHAWFFENSRSIFVLGGALAAISVLGLLDDTRRLSPLSKLTAECLIAASVLAFEPRIHEVCLYFRDQLPAVVSWAIWPLACLWIVGSANAMNLIDGIDGLAGGAGFAMIGTALGLHYLGGFSNSFMPVVLVLSLPGLALFLKRNWHPAGIFLGDSGSLGLGFLISCGAITIVPARSMGVHVVSLMMIMAFPILDMVLCVRRRRRTGHSIFRADRNHLHHRVQRLGLTTPQTSTLLIFVNAYLQVSALLILASPLPVVAALLAFTSVTSLFVLLYLIRCVEYFRSNALLTGSRSLARLCVADQPADKPAEAPESVVSVDIAPLLEVGLREEEKDVDELLSCLSFLLRRTLQPGDRLVLSQQSILVHLPRGADMEYRRRTEQRVREQLFFFQQAYQIQYSLAGLPVVTRREGGRVNQA